MKRRSIDDLIGAEPKAPEKEEPFSMDLGVVSEGVTITWLLNAFRMDRSTVKKRLGRLQPIRMLAANQPIYDFVQAASRVAPRTEEDIRKILKTIRPDDLPREMQKDYWDAKLKRQKYEREAGMLWRTEDVMNVFGEACAHIKAATQLWVNTLERKSALTPEQFETIRKLVDGLLVDIHERLSEMPKEGATANVRDLETEFEDEDV